MQLKVFRGRPRSVNIHCLEQEAHAISMMIVMSCLFLKIFTALKSNSSSHKIYFGVDSDPS